MGSSSRSGRAAGPRPRARRPLALALALAFPASVAAQDGSDGAEDGPAEATDAGARGAGSFDDDATAPDAAGDDDDASDDDATDADAAGDATDDAIDDVAVPARVRLLVPSCEAGLDWAALGDALRVELRGMGSELARAGDAAARLSLDAPCAADTDALRATLTHLETGRSATEELAVGAGADRLRVLALGLSELVRSRWRALGTAEPAPPPAPAAPDEAALRPFVERAVRAALPEPAPVEPPPAAPPAEPPLGVVLFAALGASGHPAGAHGVGELRLGASIPLGGPFGLGLELAGGGGAAHDPLGDVALGLASGALALRLGTGPAPWRVEAGVRIDGGWTYAEGLAARPGIEGAGLHAAHVAVGLDARAHVRLASRLTLVVGIDLAYALVGIDARADERRVTAQAGPRLGLIIGLGCDLDP
ncbi:MAG TPA: hypothetical protein RMH99_32745 [Sandaracinaceae bacterium LLY-WYZ-13_1]|nr:hypothetical protein [Sandaracinaceae bacterium LLY-WYZ-13_1]